MIERELVERARAGDVDAFDALVRADARRLFLVAHHILGDADAAEDAMQQTLTTIWQELPRLRDPERFEAWSYRIVTRAAFAEARQGRRRREVQLLATPTRIVPDHAPQVEDADTLARAFESLPPDRRAVVVLRYYADLSMRDIAYALGIAEGTARSRLSRALAELRAAMRRDAAIDRGVSATTGTEAPMAREGSR